MTESRRILVFGASGTIGRATVDALLRRGHRAVAVVRPVEGQGGPDSPAEVGLPESCELRIGAPTSAELLEREVFSGDTFDAVVSCMASRSGAPDDAWAVDHDANLHVLRAAERAGVDHFVLLSAICVQRPRLEFQRAKLAFEAELQGSALAWSIVRPTAFFKSISGQVERVLDGRPFLIFGDGRLNACKPIADDDLAEFIVDCLERSDMRNRILPIGGPGSAVTPRDQGELLFRVAGREPRFRSVPVALLKAAVAVLAGVGRLVPSMRPKAELARIGLYYATESMLLWDEAAGRYDADATPEYGTRTLEAYYRGRVKGELRDERGEHAIF